jgi:choline monooxygenase
MSASVRDIVEQYQETLLAEASTPPSSWYVDPGIFELEQRTVFSASWQFGARADQVQEPGQYLSGEIAGEPIAIVRGSDATVRGFFNVCRHHAAAVLTQAEGKVSHLRCPYHGWTYDLEGRLILTPDFAGVANFDRNANRLLPVQTAVWSHWLFVKMDHGGPTIEEFLGPDLIGSFEPLNLHQLHWLERRYYTLNCNWKVFVENYLDGGYHVPHIHGALNSVLDYSNYSIETGERWCLQSSPIATDKADARTAAVRTGKRASYYWIYPNFMINIYHGAMDTNLVIPRGVAKTDVIFDFYFSDVSAQARQRNLESIAVSEQIQSEDVAICESVQRGLTSRAYETGRLSVRREAGEHLFHRLLHTDLREGVKRYL